MGRCAAGVMRGTLHEATMQDELLQSASYVV
jgi:hypothetical protein